MSHHASSSRIAAAEVSGRPHAQHGGRAVLAVAAVAAVGGFLFGYDTGVISGALLYIPDTFHLTSFTQGAVVSGLLLGAAAGAVAGGTLADRIGRRLTIIIAAVIFIVGILVAILAPSVAVLIAGRVVIGLGVGVASDIVPLYIGEVAPPADRGRLVSMNQLMITSGILVAYLVDYALAPTHSWQAMLAIGIAPAVLLGGAMIFMPDSPRWLLAHGRREEAAGVLERLGQSDLLDSELAEVRDTQPLKRNWSLLLAANLRRVMIIGIGLAVLQQVTGINTVIYYAPTILRATGLGSSNAILSAIPIGVVNLLVTIVAITLVDRTGRRRLLLISLVGMVVTIGGLALCFQTHAPSGLAVTALVLYVASFAIGLGPVFWLLIAEIYPQDVRGEAMSVATAANWLANFAVAQLFPLLVTGVGRAATFWIFAAMGVFAVWFCLGLVPETKGRSLEEIEAELVGSAARDRRSGGIASGP